MSRPRLLDLFCGAGGAAMGYYRAGFDVIGVDIAPQKHYPFEFHQADALEYCSEHGKEFDAIHASPPCQAYSTMTKGRWKDRKHPLLINDVRMALLDTQKPFVIENVIGASISLNGQIMLCGTMFGLCTSSGNQLRRHRIFDVSFPITFLVPPCQHNRLSAIGVYGGGQNPARRKRRKKTEYDDIDFGISARSLVMGINWMTGKELNEAIPPAYTEFIGSHLITLLK